MPNNSDDSIPISNPNKLTANSIPAERVSLGATGDYKPCVAKLPGGDLLLSAYRTAPALHGWEGAVYHDWNESSPQRRYLETTLLFKSGDGGKSWSESRLLNVAGKEAYLSVTDKGTLLMTAHVIEQNVINEVGHCYGVLHRSPDQGQSWYTIKAQPRSANPARYHYYDLTTRNVLKLNDGSLMFIASGVGPDAHTVFRSTDDGFQWNWQYEARITGQPEAYSYSTFGEGVLWQARSGKLFCILRVDCREWPDVEGKPLEISKDELSDNFDRLILFSSIDEGRSWQPEREFGDYGQMYPAILRLQDGRLLLTFTQRAVKPPLGLRAVIGTEHDDGFEFDLQRDVFMIDAKTPEGLASGGGFGCTVQLDDGTLVSSYSYRDHPDEFAGAYSGLHLETVRWRLPSGS